MKMYYWLLLLGALSARNAQAGQALAEWSGEVNQNIPPYIGFYVKEGTGVSAQMTFDAMARTATGHGAIKVEVKDPSENPKKGNVFLIFSYPKGVEAGKKYRVTMLARASQPVEVKVGVMQDGGGYGAIGAPESDKCSVGVEWKEVSLTFTAYEGFADTRVRVPNISGIGLFERGTSLYIASWKFEQL